MNNPLERPAAYALNDRVTTLLHGQRFVGQVVAIKPPDAEHVTHRYRIATASGTELWLEEPRLQRAAKREGIG